MQLKHSFTVPVPADEAFHVLQDIERIAPCMPGATVTDVRGEEFDGQVKVKVGPMQVTYQGTARFAQVDEEARRATIEARAKETRGPGTAQATISAVLRERGDETDVEVTTDLAITGRPAQFGRGVMVEVGEKLLGQFAACLAARLAGGEAAGATSEQATPPPAAEAASEAAPAAPASEPVDDHALPPAPTPGAASLGATSPATPAPPAPAAERPTSDTIDLFEVAGAPVLKRLAPLVLLALLIGLLVRRRMERAGRGKRGRAARRLATSERALRTRPTRALRGR